MEQDQQQAEQQDAEHSTRSSASLHLSMDSEQKCKRGYLVKKGKVNTFSHRRRWFVARLGGNVQYFKVRPHTVESTIIKEGKRRERKEKGGEGKSGDWKERECFVRC